MSKKHKKARETEPPAGLSAAGAKKARKAYEEELARLQEDIASPASNG